MPGILEIMGEEGSGWDVLEAGGREEGGHLQGQRSSLLHSAGAARLSPGKGGRRVGGGGSCICPGSPKQAGPGPGIPAARGALLPAPHFPEPQFMASATFLTLWKTWVPVYSFKTVFQLLQRELHPYLWPLFSQAPKLLVSVLRNFR